MKKPSLSFYDKIRLWLFNKVLWRIVYRTTFQRNIFQSIFPLFFTNEPYVKEILGQNLKINPNRSVVEMRLHLLGMYEPEVIEYFCDYLKDGMTVVDIGANIGFLSLVIADLVGAQGKVIAYEPHPETYSELCSNIALNDYHNITTVQAAISSQSGTLNLYTSSDHAFNTIVPQDASTEIEAKCQTLDESLEELGIQKCDLIKMDIEGGELFAIQGMKKTLDRNPRLCLLVEMHNSQIRNLGGDPDDIFDFFLENNFKLYELNIRHGIASLDSSNRQPRGYLLCLR